MRRGGTQQRIGVQKALSVLVASVGVRAKVGPLSARSQSIARTEHALAWLYA